MILVLLGTQDKSFKRLLDKVEEQINLGNIKEKIVVQAGYTKYNSSNMEIFDLISNDKLNKLMDDADIIITHGGVGSIIESLKKNKKIIVCPRLKKYNEHTNNHQLQIVESFSKKGYIIPYYENDDLGKILKEIKDFKPRKYRSNTKNMINTLENYIDSII